MSWKTALHVDVDQNHVDLLISVCRIAPPQLLISTFMTGLLSSLLIELASLELYRYLAQ